MSPLAHLITLLEWIYVISVFSVAATMIHDKYASGKDIKVRNVVTLVFCSLTPMLNTIFSFLIWIDWFSFVGEFFRDVKIQIKCLPIWDMVVIRRKRQ